MTGPAGTAGLRRELGLRDLTLFAIASIVGVRWIGAAARIGPGSLLLWLAAAVFFLIPLTIAVAALTVKYPGAGGMYLWTRTDFGPWHGFLCFWTYWMGIAFWFPSAALFYASVGLDSIATRTGYLAENRLYVFAIALGLIWLALITNLVGVQVGKWTENLGGAACWVLGGMLAVLAVLVWARRGAATSFHLLPEFSWSTVSFWATIAYAISGLELVPSMGAEIVDPERNLPRAGWISSAFLVTFYSSATMALLVFLKPEQISELNGLVQAGQTAGQALNTFWFTPAIALLVILSAAGQFGATGAAVSRLPFVAGVDHLLPPVFAKIHPRFATPYACMLMLGGVATVLLVGMQFGETVRAAYQELVSLMIIAGFLPFIYIFGSAWKAGRRLAATLGWAVTVISIFCSMVPTSEIRNVWLFEGKLALGTLAVIASGWLVYRRNRPGESQKRSLLGSAATGLDV